MSLEKISDMLKELFMLVEIYQVNNNLNLKYKYIIAATLPFSV